MKFQCDNKKKFKSKSDTRNLFVIFQLVLRTTIQRKLLYIPARINEAPSMELSVCRSVSSISNLKSLLHSTSPIITFILKTQSNEIQSINTIRDLSTTKHLIVPSIGHFEGSLAPREQHLHSQDYLIFPNFVVAEIQLVMGLPVWNLVCAYGEPISHKR